MPSPVYPSLQSQVRLPGVLVQLACGSHPPFALAHSSRSRQTPAPHVEPVPHAEQVAAASPHCSSLWLAMRTQVSPLQQPSAQLPAVQVVEIFTHRPD